jgi:hypothetical protein
MVAISQISRATNLSTTFYAQACTTMVEGAVHPGLHFYGGGSFGSAVETCIGCFEIRVDLMSEASLTKNNIALIVGYSWTKLAFGI